MTTERVSARARIEGRYIAGKASDVIRGIEELAAGDKVVLWLRVSTRNQKDNLPDQERQLRAAVEARGATVVDVVKHVGPAHDDNEYDATRYWAAFKPAACLARQHGATLLATETDRLVRSPYYRAKQKKNYVFSEIARGPLAQARDADLAILNDYTDGLVVMTLTPPDASPAEVKAAQIKRGLQDPRRLTKEEKKEWVAKLSEAGLSPQRIADETGVPRTTVSRWRATYK